MPDKHSFLKIEQIAHSVTNQDKPLKYGSFRFSVGLLLDGQSKYLIGRCPNMDMYPNYTELYGIYLPSLLLTRTLAVIHASKTVYQDVHIIEALNNKQHFVDSVTNEPFTQKPLKNNNRWSIVGVPFYRFKYVLVEGDEVSGELRDQTVY